MMNQPASTYIRTPEVTIPVMNESAVVFSPLFHVCIIRLSGQQLFDGMKFRIGVELSSEKRSYRVFYVPDGCLCAPCS